jgi:hypothetical protein
MSSATIAEVGAGPPATPAAADIRTAQLHTAAVVAALGLDDPQLWRRVDGMVAELATVAYDLAAAVTGQPPGVAARDVSPVVRARELASAQRRLFHALDRHPAPAAELVARANRQVHELGRELRCVLVGC